MELRITECKHTQSFIHSVLFDGNSNGSFYLNFYCWLESINLTFREKDFTVWTVHFSVHFVCEIKSKVKGSFIDNANWLRFVGM